ncbi:MAG: phosphatidylglycerol lysyltransferase domain-containing protein [Culturomica sp.]|jgi:hypothetical protein|nr:phosphatidylglycerol lysyltransferase domain-containing protein [Culturomica sp.]
MIDFKPITVNDKQIITSYTFPFAPRDCDFSFNNLCSWHFLNESSYAVIDGFLCIRFRMPNGRPLFLLPLGSGDMISVIQRLEEEARQEGFPFYMQGAAQEIREVLERSFPTLFRYSVYRDYANYIYRRQDLVELKGKNYQPKRNHINKFKKEYRYEYTPLTPDLIPLCLEFETNWIKSHPQLEQESLTAEEASIRFSLQHYEALDLAGGVLWVEGKLAAFTFGSRLTADTFNINIEKADIHIEGAYTMINREFAAGLPDNYLYLNREEDLGIPGLRQAKLSYHPAILLEKCIAKKQLLKKRKRYEGRGLPAVESVL